MTVRSESLTPRPPAGAFERRRSEAPLRGRLLSPGWPLTLLLVGYPLFWALGLVAFVVQILAIPMGIELLRRRPIRVPRGFGIWMLFLIVSAAGILVLGVDPPGTLPDSPTGRLIGYAVRESTLVAVTILFLYIGNLSERELPDRKVARLMAVFFLVVTGFGILGLVLPRGSFRSPLEILLPHNLVAVPYIQRLVHPSFAQVQDLGGGALPRPSAPFAYTNTWGSQLSLLAIWFIVAWIVFGTRRQRIAAAVVLPVALVTLFLSLNRGVWLGVLLSVVLVAVALARRGKTLPLAALALSIAVGAVVLLGSPLHGVLQQRLENGKSDSVRAFTSKRAVELAVDSPVVGLGSTRVAVGSQQSIAIGKSPRCPLCGNVNIGTNGFLFTLLVSTGILGTLLFFGFWVDQAWRSRKDHSTVTTAGQITLVLAAFYCLFYTIELTVPFIVLALMWRRRDRRGDSDDVLPMANVVARDRAERLRDRGLRIASPRSGD